MLAEGVGEYETVQPLLERGICGIGIKIDDGVYLLVEIYFKKLLDFHGLLYYATTILGGHMVMVAKKIYFVAFH